MTTQDSNQIQRLSEETIKLAESRLKSLSELNAKFGVPFVQFLATWSGLHGSPWSYYNISQARIAIRYIRSSIKDALQIWGRRLSPLEEIILDIGEADSECGVLSGGVTSISEKLYVASLEKLSNGQSEPMQVLLRAHCIASLTRLQLAVPVNDTEATMNLAMCEKETEASMMKLDDLLASIETTPYFYVWRQKSSLSSSILYHISMKRQLIAELLLHASRQDEARSFLEDAVKASPQNYDVAFAYGSFLLQIAMYTDGCDQGLSKKAQVQLLKSAKLNTAKADPFALLGIWYELQDDNKRSVGCYAKALLVDPTHPVAGRGMMRAKKSANGVSTLLDNALNMGYVQNGWAWKASGDANAFIEGDDERAVICYQQALRARDVGNPKQHRLHMFFSLPKDRLTGMNDCAKTWASLGGCYRRLGKHSASVRAFQAAHEINPHDRSYFCSWAQG